MIEKNIFLLLLLAVQFISFGQFDISITDHSHTCGAGSCNGTISFFYDTDNNSPIEVSHSTGTSTIGSNGGSGGWGQGNLCPGVYHFHFEDTLGNIFDTSLNILEFPIFTAELVISESNSDANSCDGQASTRALMGGIEPINIVVFLKCDSNTIAEPTSLCPGDYYAVVEDSVGCKDYTPCISTKIKIPQTDSMLFDNPNDLELIVQSTALFIINPYESVRLYNLLGQVVLESYIANKKYIQFNGLANGAYIVSIQRSKDSYTQKIIKIDG